MIINFMCFRILQTSCQFLSLLVKIVAKVSLDNRIYIDIEELLTI